MLQIKVGIIGGTGLDRAELFTLEREEEVSTPFGSPSDLLKHGTISGVPCVLLPRHDRNHSIMPSKVNFRANLYALRSVGCTHVLAATACGSLREDYKPGDFVVLDSFIDRTTKRDTTFYDGSCEEFVGIPHLPMAEPFCPSTRKVLYTASTLVPSQSDTHEKGVMVTIEGPRFSSKAESKMFRTLGGDLINMTTVPEVVLARELGLCYAALALVTDYDCWREAQEGVSVKVVMECMRKNSERATEVFKRTVELLAQKDWTDTVEDLKKSVAMNIMLPKS